MTNDVPARDDVPPLLCEYDQWICWRKQERNGKLTKVPINPETRKFASATNPDSWGAFETARELAPEMDGLGFVFTDNDPLVGVDLDDCRDPETGQPADWAKEVIDTLDSFTEVSPSGTGYHVLLEGELAGDRNRKDNLEMYDSARFFTVTGDHVDGTPISIEHRTDPLNDVYEAYILETEPADETQPPTQDTNDHSLGDDELLEKARSAANGAAFAQLYRGSTSGYESHSEADMALCSHLAFWTGGDAAQVDRLFRNSGLMREKWDEQHFADGSTYGEKTIERAIAGTQEFYEPGGTSTRASGVEAGTQSGDRQTRSTSNADTQSAQSSTLQSTSEQHETATADLRAREIERMERLEELQQQLRSVIDEKEALEAELADERAKRRELESELQSRDDAGRSLLPWR